MINRISIPIAGACCVALLSACGQLSSLKLPPKYGELTLENAKIEWVQGPAELILPSGGSIGIPPVQAGRREPGGSCGRCAAA